MNEARPHARLSRRALLTSALAAAGCSSAPRPPLRALYAATPTSPEQPPLVIVPGAFGSRLRDNGTGRIIWPGSNAQLLFSSYDDLEVPIDPDSLEPAPSTVGPAGLFENGMGRDFYGKLLDTLQAAGGYRWRQPGDQPEAGERNFYVYDYDWRQDGVAAARGLHALIERLRDDYQNPHLEVDIVSHSNGGLVARYYARYGTAALPENELPCATCEGAASIRRLVTLGTPNLGTIQAALSHTRGEEIGLRHISPEVVASCIGVAELMPHDSMSWIVDVRGEPIPRSIYDAETWRELRWSIFDPRVRERAITRHGGGAEGRRYLETLERYFAKSLRIGRAFSNALAAPAPEADVAPYVFGADCTPTLARLVVEYVGGEAIAREAPAEIVHTVPGVDYRALMFQPGDLVVTRESLLGRCTSVDSPNCAVRDALRIRHSVFLCEEHQSLTGNASFQNNLLYTLLSA